MSTPDRQASVRTIESEVGVLIRRVRRVVAERAQEVHESLHPSTFILLNHLHDHGPLRASSLVEHFAMDKASVSRQGNRYQYGWVLDLAATGASLDARAWPLPQDAVPSEFSLIVDAKALAAFHSTLPAEGLACLVIEENGIEHWIAPRYGLVREAKAGTFQRDLVYTNTKRNTSP